MTMPLLEPYQLMPRARTIARAALATGALQPIHTEEQTVQQDGIPFSLRVVRGISPKRAHAKAKDPDHNPFLSPDPKLTVGAISASHLCLLNKFNVLDDHLLFVTRRFIAQETRLDAHDFAAVAFGLSALDGLAFYNAGRVAGASQNHKHLQLVPALGPGHHRVPIEVLVNEASPTATRLPLPFVHAFAHINSFRDRQELEQRYGALLDSFSPTGPPAQTPHLAYNLLVTRRWMLVVPRCRGRVDGVSINALGFAGALLFFRHAQRDLAKKRGLSTLLSRSVCPP